jgi:hypothetical protein
LQRFKTVDIFHVQGDTFRMSAVCKQPNGSAVNLTGYVARFQARLRPDSATAVAEGASSGSSPTATVTVVPADGLVLVSTDAFTDVARLYYDLELTSQNGLGIRETIVRGSIAVLPEITR